MWPSEKAAWNYWTERRFKTYCENWRVMSWAGGSHIGKSVDAGKLALLEYFSNRTKNGVIVASTTLEAIKSRIYGYVLAYLRKTKLPLDYIMVRGNNQKICSIRDDTIHAVSPIAAAKGKDPEAIKNYIGRHPEGKLLLILDEAPDLDPVIMDAVTNLEKEGRNFQILVIGNSASTMDLHGILSTPKVGWDKIDPYKDTKWETTQEGGICLYFSPYESPAIYEKDPEKKKLLSSFLPTLEEIEKKKIKHGEKSYNFWRYVLGFWQKTLADNHVLHRQFLEQFHVSKRSEWAGVHPLNYVAGLDVAFSTGGDDCILRLAKLGVDVNGQVCLDFCGDSLLFKIEINPYLKDEIGQDVAAEIQIAKQVLTILAKYNIPLNHLVIDATGQGRALGGVIKLESKGVLAPLKIYSMRGNEITPKQSFDVIVKSAYELWFTLRDYIQEGQIRGLDAATIHQLSSRLTETKGNKTVLESKLAFKQRMGSILPELARSPDEADSAALCLQSALYSYGFRIGQTKEVRKEPRDWLDNKLQAFQQQRKEAEEAKKNPVLRPMPSVTFKTPLTQAVKFKPSLH